MPCVFQAQFPILADHRQAATMTAGELRCRLTGIQPPQSTVAEAGILFAFTDVLEIQSEAPERFGGCVLNTEAQ